MNRLRILVLTSGLVLGGALMAGPAGALPAPSVGPEAVGPAVTIPTTTTTRPPRLDPCAVVAGCRPPVLVDPCHSTRQGCTPPTTSPEDPGRPSDEDTPQTDVDEPVPAKAVFTG